jgi:2-keto-4-pentenoate hydratase/2-oxohepta-3-ene-1,7-dioic acid hydratase in catechol pathway
MHFKLPKDSPPNTVNYEVELGVILKNGNHTGRPIGEKWKEYIAGYFLLLDYTDTAALKAA